MFDFKCCWILVSFFFLFVLERLLMGSSNECIGVIDISMWFVIIFKLGCIVDKIFISVNVLSELIGWFVIIIILFLLGICFICFGL